MNLYYLFFALAIFTFLPTNIAEKLKPGDPYLFTALLIIGKSFFDRRKEMKKFLLHLRIPFLLVLLSYLISSLFSYYLPDSLKFTFRFFLLMLLVPATASLIKEKKEILSLLSTLLFFGVITGLHAAYQIKNPPPVIQGISAVEGLSYVRVFATFFNANIYAEFLLIVISAGIGLFFAESSRLKKGIYLGGVVFLLAILFFTYSRGSLLGLIVSIFIFFALTYPKFLIPAFGVGTVILAVVPGLFERLINTITFVDSSQFLRLQIWNAAFAPINSWQKLIFGLGPYSFKYEVMDVVRKSPEIFFGYFSFQPHNIYILWLFEGGILMILAWMFYYAHILYYGVKSFLSLSEEKVKFVVASLVAANAGLLVNGITETIYYHNQVLPVWFLVQGIILWFYVKTTQASNE